MQQGSIIGCESKHGPAVCSSGGRKLDLRANVFTVSASVGTVGAGVNSETVRESVKVLIAKPSATNRHMKPTAMTLGEPYQYSQQRELVQDGNHPSFRSL